MAIGARPTLSTQGWVTDSMSLLARILADYILTDAEQSLIYRDELCSLPKTWYENIRSGADFAEAMKLDLGKMLRRHFENYDISTEFSVGESNFVTVYIYISVIDTQGIKHSVGNIATVDEENLGKIIKIVNGTNGYADGVVFYREYIKR